MKVDNIDVNATIEKAKQLLNEEKDLSSALKATFELLLLLVSVLLDRLNLNSRNSSKPPSSDPNRKKKQRKKGQRNRKPGGQKGHTGTTLEPVDDPDQVEIIDIDRRTLPKGDYTEAGYEKRQVIDIRISRFVTEYQAQILEDQAGHQYVAPFPTKVTRVVQYGNSLKVNAVYMSQYQLIPYQRVQDHFSDQMHIPISTGSLCNFNREVYELLATADQIIKQKLVDSDIIHADETGINVGGKRIWLHSASNESWSYFYPHEKRGGEAMNEIGILPRFKGVLCHDHWKPYYQYDQCSHSLCNAHHLRELLRAEEQDGQRWAKDMGLLLEETNIKVIQAGGALVLREANKHREEYRKILTSADKECPPPAASERKHTRGRIKRSKSRNLLERLRDYEDDVLRFMENELVPFTNNIGENDIRMTKVQQKISGCFRSMLGAKIFCRIRSYLLTCSKHGLKATEALNLLYDGKLPDFFSDP